MIYLMYQKIHQFYYILNSETDCIGAMHNDMPSIINAECTVSAENMPYLLHQLQESKVGKWYVATDWIGSDGKYRHDEYKIHQALHRLDGYIKNVCDIRFNDECYLRDWEVDFVSDLWCKHSNYELKRVVKFSENMLLEVEKYMKKHNLKVS